jgi:hypothetical protein
MIPPSSISVGTRRTVNAGTFPSGVSLPLPVLDHPPKKQKTNKKQEENERKRKKKEEEKRTRDKRFRLLSIPGLSSFLFCGMESQTTNETRAYVLITVTVLN